MRMMQVKKGKRSRMNRSRPSTKPDDRACDPQVVPFKKRARFLCSDEQVVPFKKRAPFLCSDDTRLVCQFEKIGPSDDRRVRPRSDVANTRESKKTEIGQIEKKLSNTANDEVTHASMAPAAIRPSEGSLPLATTASEEDRVKDRERAENPVIIAPSEPQGVSVVDGSIKQVNALKEFTEHEGDGGESTKSGPQGEGGSGGIDVPLNPAYLIAIPQGGSGGIDVHLTEEHQKNSNKPIEYIVIESSDSEQELEDPYSPIVGHGAPMNPAYPIPNPEGGSGGGGGPRGGSLSDQTADRGLYARAQSVIDIPMSQHPMTITLFKKESKNSHKLHEGSQDGGSADGEQNANHTIRFWGFDIPCQKHTAATNTKDSDASGGAAADGSPLMRDSDASRQQVHPASTGTGDGARNSSQEPLADGRGESSMRRTKAGLCLLGFDI